MSLRSVRVLTLLIFAFSISASAQSLGDVARQVRLARQQNPAPRARVITNDDLATEPDSDLSKEPSPDDARNERRVTAPAVSGAAAEAESEGPKNGKSSDKTPTDPREERAAQEVETQKRTKEINQRYLDRITALRTQLSTAQLELAKIQRDQVESTNEFRRTLGVSPNLGTYEQQQRTLLDQMEAQRNLINSLNSQLEDAGESARHAGVPHISD